MEKVGNILETYAYKKKFMAYGFGARTEGADKVDHCFALNGNLEDPSIEGLPNLI